MFLSFLSKHKITTKDKKYKEIIPVINVKTIKKLEERLKLISRFSGTIQIDIADGIFTSWKTWNDPSYLKHLKRITNRLELHLMINNPDNDVSLWLESHPKRIIVSWEAIKDFSKLKKYFIKSSTELGIAINPLTSIEQLKTIISEFNYLVVLAVNPGPSGQQFQWFVLDKINEIKKQYPFLTVEIDGGVNEQTIDEILKTKVDVLAIGSAIFEKSDPMAQIEYFNKLLQAKV